MTGKKKAVKAVQKEETPDEIRNRYRAGLVGTKIKSETKEIHAFGYDIELKQPTLGSVLQSTEESDSRAQVTTFMINNAYIPGTDIQIFEEGDEPQILAWPFGPEYVKIQEAINELMGVDIAGAEEELKSPLAEPS